MRLGIICLCLMIPNLALAAGITAANFIEPTSRYDHGILGDDIEWGGLPILTGMAGLKSPISTARIWQRYCGCGARTDRHIYHMLPIRLGLQITR